jgi:hypothetical protein
MLIYIVDKILDAGFRSVEFPEIEMLIYIADNFWMLFFFNQSTGHCGHIGTIFFGSSKGHGCAHVGMIIFEGKRS